MNRARFLVLVAIVAVELVSTRAEPTVVNVQNYEGVFTKVDISSIDDDGQERLVSYYVSNFGATWQDANDTCVNLIKKKFVSVQNSTVYSEISTAMDAAGAAYSWTSGKFSPTTSSFIWTASGESFTYTKWMDGNRNHNFQSNPCVGIWTSSFNLGWIAYPCTYSYNFICE